MDHSTQINLHYTLQKQLQSIDVQFIVTAIMCSSILVYVDITQTYTIEHSWHLSKPSQYYDIVTVEEVFHAAYVGTVYIISVLQGF